MRRSLPLFTVLTGLALGQLAPANAQNGASGDTTGPIEKPKAAAAQPADREPDQAIQASEQADEARERAEEAKERAREQADQAREQAEEAKEQAREQAEQAKEQAEQAKEQAEEEAQRVKELAEEQAAQAKELADQQLDQVQQQLDQVRGAMASLAAAGVEAPEPPEPPEQPEPPEVFDGNLAISVGDGADSLFHRTGNAVASPTIIASEKLDNSKLGDIREDMAVMGRILSKAAERASGREGPAAAAGISLWTFPTARQTTCIHLEGFGAVFQLHVHFPLVAPEKVENKAEPAEDSTWEKTKQELYGGGANKSFCYVVSTGSKQVAVYDPERVENLKKVILESLKNASHLRNLKSSDAIVVAVTGGRSGGVAFVKAKNTGRQDLASKLMASDKATQSTLTIRITKADADRFDKGEISFAEFSKAATVATY